MIATIATSGPAATQVLPAEAAPSRNYLPALAVYVIWHPKNQRGPELALSLLDRLTSDSKDPLDRGIGIPVYYRTGTPDAPEPAPIDVGQATRTAVVVLIDDEMIDDRDNGWSAYVNRIWTDTNRNESNHRMLPVALSRYAFNFSPAIRESNFIRFYQSDREKQVIELTINVTHELCRLLLKERRVDHENPEAATVSDRVKVFISHAKGDGLAIAKAINAFIRNDTQLTTFFDSNEIMVGDDFGEVIRQEAARCAMLVVQTDTYGSRYWCQEEILLAKAFKRPVLVLDAIERGETRSFPYLYNGPKVRCAGAGPLRIEPIVEHLLLEVLRTEHAARQFEGLRELFNIPKGEGIEFLPYPPELLTLAELRLREKVEAADGRQPRREPARTFVYPDPPLGLNETRRLSVFAEGLRLVSLTPLLAEGQLRAGDGGGVGAAGPRPSTGQGTAVAEAAAERAKEGSQADGKLVGLSLSDVPKDHLLARGLGPEHLTRATVQFARFLLAAGHHLAYGGDLRGDGFTGIIHDLVKTYNDENQGPKDVLVNYLDWYIHEQATAEQKARFTEAARQVEVGLPADLSRYKAGPPNNDPATLSYIRARALTEMRQRMNREIQARVILGGRLVGYRGAYPGVVEEAAIAVSTNQPLYLIGGFGGAALAIIQAIEAKAPEALKADYQLDVAHNPGYAARVEDFNSRVTGPTVDLIDYDKLAAVFMGCRVEGLSAHNGLSIEENTKLFRTPHVEEMIYLVLTGLLKIGHGSAGST
jgi:hypothetical protein